MDISSLYDKSAILAGETGLERVYPVLRAFLKPGLAIRMAKAEPGQALGKQSHLGGTPDLPPGFMWPEHLGRPLDFLLQVNCAEYESYDTEDRLPKAGMLSFFYDLAEQPWGSDPEDQDGFQVVYFENIALLEICQLPKKSKPIPACSLQFSPCLTAPSPWSRVYEKLQQKITFTSDEKDAYFTFIEKLDSMAYPKGGQHRLSGHSANIQGDMQLEAQLVSHGINCGGPDGYRSPKAAELEAGADDWRLLLQLDSERQANLTWGDGGMLYFWIRSQDLQSRAFDHTWMELQCN